jgi:hypothetical protein
MKKRNLEIEKLGKFLIHFQAIYVSFNDHEEVNFLYYGRALHDSFGTPYRRAGCTWHLPQKWARCIWHPLKEDRVHLACSKSRVLCPSIEAYTRGLIIGTRMDI